MAKSCTIKERILAIERMFQHKRPLTVRMIIDKLDLEYDIQVERKTVYDDLAVLTLFMNIQRIRKGNEFVYWLEDLNKTLMEDR